MKKRIVLKKWVENLLLIIMVLAVLVIASDCISTGVFLISHAIAVVILVGSARVIEKYGRDND